MDLRSPKAWPALADWVGASVAVSWAAYFLLASTVALTDLPSWHDEQRAIQVLLLAVTAPIAARKASNFDLRIGTLIRASLAAFALFALMSSSSATLPDHSFAELALFVGLIGLAIFIATEVVRRPGEVSVAWSQFCLLLGAAHVTGILTRYFAALSLETSIGIDVLLMGFANPRFPSALYAILMPFIAALAVDQSSRRSVRVAAAVTLSLLWMVNIGLGTRAIFFVYVLAGLAFLSLSDMQLARSQLRMLARTLGLGVALYLLLFVAVPRWMDLPFAEVARDPTSLAGTSGRIELWVHGGSLLLAAPFLGVGPMHFAAHAHSYGAHPHNWPIQVAAEYGLPSLLLMSLLLWRLLRTGARALRQHEAMQANIEAAALLACLVAVIYGFVDGNYLMPMSQSAMAVAFGLLLGSSGFFRAPVNVSLTPRRRVLGAVALVLSVAASVYLVSYSLSTYSSQLSFEGDYHLPRFWEQGLLVPLRPASSE
jgi:O-antigen ligase